MPVLSVSATNTSLAPPKTLPVIPTVWSRQ
jgi:hypothetical protein